MNIIKPPQNQDEGTFSVIMSGFQVKMIIDALLTYRTYYERNLDISIRDEVQELIDRLAEAINNITCD
jgi:hypothetical protein